MTRMLNKCIHLKYLHSDGVFLLWPVEADSGDVVLRGDQQRIKGSSAPSGLCGYRRPLGSQQRIDQVHILLSGILLRGREKGDVQRINSCLSISLCEDNGTSPHRDDTGVFSVLLLALGDIQ